MVQEDNLTSTQLLPHAEAEELPSIDDGHSMYIPPLKYVPKSASCDFARELPRMWQDLCEDMSDKRLWLLHAINARCIVPACMDARVATFSSQGKLVKERLTRWRGNVFEGPWMEAVKFLKL